MTEVATSWTPDPFATQFERRDDGALILRPRARAAAVSAATRGFARTLGARGSRRACWSRDADADGAWRTVTYAQMLARVQRLAAGLLTRNLSAERPIAILSGNSIEHLTLAPGSDVGRHSVLSRVARLLTGRWRSGKTAVCDGSAHARTGRRFRYSALRARAVVHCCRCGDRRRRAAVRSAGVDAGLAGA